MGGANPEVKCYSRDLATCSYMYVGQEGEVDLLGVASSF